MRDKTDGGGESAEKLKGLCKRGLGAISYRDKHDTYDKKRRHGDGGGTRLKDEVV